MVAEPAAVPDDTSGNHNRRWADYRRRGKRKVVQNATAQDVGMVQDNNSLMEMAVHVPCVLALRFVLMVEYPVLLQDCPLVDEWPVFRQRVG